MFPQQLEELVYNEHSTQRVFGAQKIACRLIYNNISLSSSSCPCMWGQNDI